MYINKHIGDAVSKEHIRHEKCSCESTLLSVSSENGGIYHEGHRLSE